MNYDIKKESDHSYFVIGCDDKKEGYEKKMILENEIAGFLPVRYDHAGTNDENAQNSLMYEITGRDTMVQKFPYQSFRFKDAVKLLDKIINAFEQVDEYMLDPRSLILVPEVIFYKKDEPGFCYLPMFHQDINKAFKNLMSFMISHADYNDQACIKGLYELNSYVVDEDFCISGLKAYLKEHKQNENRYEERRKEYRPVSSNYVNEERDRQISKAADIFYEEISDKSMEKDADGSGLKIRAALTIGAFIGIFAGLVAFVLRSGADTSRIVASLVVCAILCSYTLEKQLHLIRDTKRKLIKLKDFGVNIDDFEIGER